MSLASGATFAGYTIVRQLSCGDTDEVFLVEHPRRPGRHALKILPGPLTADAEYRARFTYETDVAATLYHPHIVAVHDSGECDGRLWIATDYIDGTDAEQLIAHRFPAGMPPGQALAIVTAIAEALDYAHQRGLLHRDVKPANILLAAPDNGNPRILLADFGVARQLGSAGTLTANNLTWGTVAYAAPEQLLGTGIDGRADQYGLASTAFQLLTGAPPVTGANPVVAISQKLTMPPLELADRSPELKRLDQVMSAALAKDPVDRYGSCREFAEALSQRAGSTARGLSPEAALHAAETMPRIECAAGTRRRRPATRRQRRWLVLGLTIGAVLAAALLAVGIVHNHGDDAATNTAPTRPSFPVPTTTPASGVPAQSPQLEGTYRVDTSRSRQTFNGIANPQPPDVTTWWAFRSACRPAGCVAAGIMLDDSRQATAPAGNTLWLDFFDGHWQSRPLTARFPCVDHNGQAGMQTTTEVLSLRSPDQGPLRGEMTVTVETNECGQQGGVIQAPAVAMRRADLPPGVEVPDPAG
jgi:serine/threonine-protein kinase